MKRLTILAVACCASLAFAEDKAVMKQATTPTTATAAAPQQGMPEFHPRKPMHEKDVKKELDAWVAEHDAATKAADVGAMVESVDFPVLMVTDNAQGNASSMSVTKEQFTKMMTDSMKGMSKDMMVTTKHKYDILTDSLAVIHNDSSMTMGGRKMSWSGAAIAIKKDGKWLCKTMVEGGWGDMKPAGAANAGMK